MNLILEPLLIKGFEDQVGGATDTFRAVLDAMSKPGRVLPLPVIPEVPEGLRSGSVAVLLTLADTDTPVWLAPECDTEQARAHLRFHAGCPITDTPSQAAFAVMTTASELSAIDLLAIGTVEYPDRSTTVIIESEVLTTGIGPCFSGPGIKDDCQFSLAGSQKELWLRLSDNHLLFPRGLDWIFTSSTHVAALPRSTKVEI